MMIEFDEYKVKLNGLKPVFDTLRSALKMDAAIEEIAELEAKSAEDGFWNDVENAQKTLQQIKKLKNKCEVYDQLKKAWDDLFTLCEMAIERK